MEPQAIDLDALRDMIPFAAALGIELVEARPELVRGRLGWATERTTTADVMHGGAIMALADTCGGVCAFLNLPEGARGTATIESRRTFCGRSAADTSPRPPARYTLDGSWPSSRRRSRVTTGSSPRR